MFILKRSIDARQRRLKLKVAVYLKGELRLPEYGNVATAQVGAGPAGLLPCG
jgi:hypothetical protein